MSDSAKAQVLAAYDLLRLMKSDLSDFIQDEVSEWMGDLRDEIRACKASDDECASVDWNSFGEWLNEICRDDGMPCLYVRGEE